MIAEFRFRIDDDEHEPGRAPCAGCRVRLALRAGVSFDRLAYSEDTDLYGRKRYYCRECTDRLYTIS